MAIILKTVQIYKMFPIWLHSNLRRTRKYKQKSNFTRV